MPHSFVSNRLHIVFSTRERKKLVPLQIQPRLWAYIAGVGRNHQLTIHEVGGIDNHAHVFLSLPAAITLAEAVQKLKANSSRWLREEGVENCSWQEGYSAFSVSASNAAAVVKYIKTQQQHHKKLTFEDELLTLLDKHGIKYDPELVFG